MDIRLDKETFKALASETRVSVLKVLNERRHMQSEIAASLNLSVPTVKEHLTALEKAGLVERFDEGRKWKYYALTKKGKGVLNPEEMKIWIVLGTFLLSAVGSAVSWMKAPVAGEMMQTEAVALKAAPMVAEMDTFAMSAPAPIPEPNILLYVFITFSVVSLLVLVYLLYKSAQYKKQLGISLTKK